MSGYRELMSVGEAGKKPYHLLTVDELRALNAHRRGPDTTPLTDAEKAALRRRLNAPGGASLKLPYRARAALWEMGIIRWPEDVQKLYAKAQARQTHPQMQQGSIEYCQGILAAIDWATGKVGLAPLSAEPSEEIPPSATQMSRETVLGSDIAEGRVGHPRGRSFAAGVEHTLLWLRARAEDPPL